jgi:hypothetical protein
MPPDSVDGDIAPEPGFDAATAYHTRAQSSPVWGRSSSSGWMTWEAGWSPKGRVELRAGVERQPGHPRTGTQAGTALIELDHVDSDTRQPL